MGSSYFVDGAMILDGNYAHLEEYDICINRDVHDTFVSEKGGRFAVTVVNEGSHF